MKNRSRILILALLLAVALLPAACRAEEGGAVTWRGYALKAEWLTTDRDAINMSDLAADALAVLVRLAPQEGVLQLGDIQNNQDDFTLVDADGDAWQAQRFVYHNIEMNPVTNFPSISQEQDGVELLFLLTGKDEAALAGAQLKLAGAEPEALALDGVTRDKPE